MMKIMQLWVAFTDDVIPLISALEQRFTSYDIDQIAKLTSKVCN